MKKVMIITLVTLLVLAIVGIAFLNTAKFGKLPAGDRLARIEQAPNYRDGAFHNQSHTPDLTEGAGYWEVAKEFLFTKKPNLNPVDSIPSIKTDLLALPPDRDVLVWFGHSSYYLQVDGRKFLVDPVLSGSASPLPFGTKSFAGTDIYGVDDFPEIDVLFISHDHWDHLDYETIKALKPKIKQVICGLGVGAHFEHWGYDPAVVIEKNWNETVPLDSGFTVHTLPARHFSGRGLKRFKSLWLSFALQTPTMNIYIGG
ncbi:MAG: MBL fold metallo-hydrolase, partial [Cryomorphaceae bacterium]